MSNNNMILVYITNPSKEKANHIAHHLLEKKLIACANIFSVDSHYWWEGKIEQANEFVLIAKTIPQNYNNLKEEVEKIHPYSTPCIIKIPVQANEKYFSWLNNEVREC